MATIVEPITIQAPVGVKSPNTTIAKKVVVKFEKYKHPKVLNNLAVSFYIGKNQETGQNELVPCEAFGTGKQVVGDIVLLIPQFDARGMWYLVINDEAAFKKAGYSIFGDVVEQLEKELRVSLAEWIYGREFDTVFDLSKIYPDLVDRRARLFEEKTTRWEKRFKFDIPEGSRITGLHPEVVSVEHLLNKFGADKSDNWYVSDGKGFKKPIPAIKLGLSVAEVITRRKSGQNYLIRVSDSRVNTYQLVKDKESEKQNEKPMV